MAKNPSTAPAATEDAFDDATGADFTRISDVDGRSMVVWALELDKAKGNDGEPYDYVQAEVIVLDGEDTEKVTVGELFEIRFTTDSIVRQLKKNLASGRPRLGRVSSMKSRYGTRAYSLDPVPEDSPARAKVAAALATREAAQTAEANAKVDDEPFN